MGVVWPFLALVVVLYAAHGSLGLGGRGADGLFDYWINDGLLWCGAIACAAGALRASRSRAPWLLVALALASWAVGSTIWSIRFGGAAAPPQTSISDAFWLAWYPLIVAALVLLIRDRIPGFELHRWIDGIAVMLLVATPWVALFLQPVAEHSSASGLAIVLNIAYPLGDAVLVGAVLGLFVLMDWRPGRMWLALGVGLMAIGIADAISSVQALEHTHDLGTYDAAWAGAAVLVAYSAWQPYPGRLERREVTGWRAIGLAVSAQVLAISLQTYAFFHELPRSERILTVLVLVIATIQIVVSRPRPRSGTRTEQDPPGSGAPGMNSDRPATPRSEQRGDHREPADRAATSPQSSRTG
jgi:drug/metabolite transporter (DMT)-like permease